MKQIVLASHNPGKLKELQELLAPFDIQLLSAADVDLTDAEETGDTFEQNAILKAVAASKASGLPAIADDSGLCVHALKDAPGVYSARYAAKMGGYLQAFEDLERQLQDKEDRSAHFTSVIALAYPNGNVQTFEGRVDGTIVPSKGTAGFGFDPIFMPDGFTKTFAQMSSDEKNKISHRGLAIAAFIQGVKDTFS